MSRYVNEPGAWHNRNIIAFCAAAPLKVEVRRQCRESGDNSNGTRHLSANDFPLLFGRMFLHRNRTRIVSEREHTQLEAPQRSKLRRPTRADVIARLIWLEFTLFSRQAVESNRFTADLFSVPCRSFRLKSKLKFGRFTFRESGVSVHSGVESLSESAASEGDSLIADRSEPTEMPAASKEQRAAGEAGVPAKRAVTSSDDGSVFVLLYSLVKKVTAVGAVYLVGYMGWSVAWLVTPVVLAVTREYWRHSNQLRRSIAQASATANEKDVILARINDLPAWVYFPDIERCEWINRVKSFASGFRRPATV